MLTLPRAYSTASLVAILPHEHVLGAHANLQRLPEALEDVLLHVGDAVLLAHGLDLGGGALVGEHRHVGPHVVLDLVVEPSVEVVVDVGAGPEVDGADDGAEVELVALDLDGGLEAVDVLTGVVGHDDDERVDVGEDLGGEEVGERAEGHHLAEEGVEDEGGDDEVGREVRGEDPKHDLEGVEVAPEHGHEDRLHGGGLGRDAVVAGRLGHLKGLLLEGLALGLGKHLLPLVHLLDRVGGVVEPFPHDHEHEHLEVLEGGGDELVDADRVRVALKEVGVRGLPQLVVVLEVVLHIPSLGEHPVAPVDEAPHGALGELGPVEAVLSPNHTVVAAVACVMTNHGPANADGHRQQDRRDGVPGQLRPAGGGETEGVDGQGPVAHLLEVVEVLLAHLLASLLLDGADLLAPSLKVEVLAPGGELPPSFGLAGEGHITRHSGSPADIGEEAGRSRGPVQAANALQPRAGEGRGGEAGPGQGGGNREGRRGPSRGQESEGEKLHVDGSQ
mmetsp:Transcript_2137/g.5404  ORF Transcript_2137/g.5404 Transcript_2137/m.5404 type:complete len:503 (-) Transcript_2137:155-1663(-)